MKSLKLKEGITWIGALDPDLEAFDIIMYTEFGTTYNSYVVKGSDKIAVIETVKEEFYEDYLEKLREVIEPEDIDYIIVNHTEPDHVGSAARLLDLATQAEFIGSKTAIRFLKQIVNKPFKHTIVDEGDELSLGDKTLQFISAPFLHWPDTIYTYVKEDKVLFTCDSFGAHYCFDDVLYSKVENHKDYEKALKYYFDMIMGPFKSHMLKAISKIEPLEIDMICTGHGPVLDKEPMKVVEKCQVWSTESNPNQSTTVIMPYVSSYGYTAKIAQEIKNGIESVGGIQVELFDMEHEDKDEVLSKLRWADGILFGSPTINSDTLPPIWELLIRLSPLIHGRKQASAFGSYGWSGEAIGIIESRLKQLRMKVTPGLKILFRPNETELKQAFDFGVDFASKLN